MNYILARSLLLLLLSLTVAGCTQTKPAVSPPVENNEQSMNPVLTPAVQQTVSLPYTATFEIYTNGTKRIFTDAKYHNQSAEVFIEASDPKTITGLAPDKTWDDFFKTLPFSLDNNCLITGTNQTFCTNDTHALKFYLNDIDTPNALDMKIGAGDTLRVEYGQK